jgi:hypothetical protein
MGETITIDTEQQITTVTKEEEVQESVVDSMKEIIESKPAKKEEVSIDLKPKETEELPSAVSIEEVVTPSEVLYL